MSINAHQNFLIMQRKRQIYILDQMSKEWEVDYQDTLHASSGLFICERIVFGGQGHFGSFLFSKCNTDNGIREIMQRNDSFQLRSS